MPALDTSAANVALGQLTNLPFRNLIGGPLNAAIESQAGAAQTTVDFIQSVAFREIDGELDPIYVEFLFEDSSGITRRIKVPLLLILPIPFIVIDSVDIQFKARIAASAGQASESGEQTSGRVSAYGRFRFWGQRLDIAASYSSKKDSKASQESKYSVEYTMDVHVHASQAGIPQGMAEILNILQEGVSNVPTETQLKIFSLPSLLMIDDKGAFEGSGADFKVLVLDRVGEPIPNAKVDVSSAEGLIEPRTAEANDAGIATVVLALASDQTLPDGDTSLTLLVRASDGSNDVTANRQVTVRK